MTKPTHRVRKWLLTTLALSLLIPLLAACNTKKDDNSDNRRTLRIGTMYGSKQDEYWFRQQTTDLFEFSHSNIDIEIVPANDYNEMQFENQGKEPQKQPDPMVKVKEIMTGPNPVDVMIFDMPVLRQLVDENLLKNLEPLLKEDQIDTNEFVPTVIDGIKEQGNGQLYALTPTFMPSALFYNKKLFAKAGVTPPKDGMSWDDVFNLARQMKSGSGKDAQYGFTFNSWGSGENFYDVQTFAAPLQLKMFDEKAETMTVNSPQWKSVWESVTGLYKDHVMPRQEDMQALYEQPQKEGEPYNPFQGRLFMSGKAAMTIGNYGLISEIEQMNANADKLKMEKLDWEVVTTPFHTSVPGVGGEITLSQLAGINAKAANAADAWEFVKFMNGKEWAKFKSRSTYEMPARKEFVKPREGLVFNIEAFTKMKPAPMQRSLKEEALYRDKPNLNMVFELGNRYYMDVIQGKKSVDEALKEWETKGNDLLQKIKTNPTGNIEGIFDDVYGGGKPGH
jgi:multiple sugar transport system substrate-binding protein